jgi:cytochrome c oxidase cbb3-type subunit 3
MGVQRGFGAGMSANVKRKVRDRVWKVLGVAAGCVALLGAQQNRNGSPEGIEQRSYKDMTPSQRAEATRDFLGLGAVPDRVAARRGKRLYGASCAFCHGANARGASAPSLITSDIVLGDDHGEHLATFLRTGRPDKGMPAFTRMSEQQLREVGEFLHVEVENVANRGAYEVLNIVVGNAGNGKAYVDQHCMRCHSAATFAHIASRFRSPEQLQRDWIWPAGKGAITATVKGPAGTVTGRAVQISDFRITLVDESGKTVQVDRGQEVQVHLHDPRAAHEEMLLTLANDDMHDVTAFLETQK